MTLFGFGSHAAGALAVTAGLAVSGLLAGIAGIALLQEKAAVVEARRSEIDLLAGRKPPPGPAPWRFADPYVEGETAQLAANALQERVASLVELTGGNLVSIGTEQGSGGETGRVLVQASAETKLEGLQTLLYRLEAEVPFVFVESLSVQAAGEDKTIGEDRLLRVDLLVSAHHRRSAK